MPKSARARLLAGDRRRQLEDAALACILRGGIRAFTVDQVSAHVGVSRGLIAHHFGSIDGLLVAVHDRMYRQWSEVVASPRPGLLPVEAMIGALLSDDLFSHDVQSIWLTLWGEIANNAVLRAEHRAQFAAYRDTTVAALRASAAARDRRIDADALATAMICLLDGFGVQRCIEPAFLSADMARAACRALLEPHLGPLNL